MEYSRLHIIISDDFHIYGAEFALIYTRNNTVDNIFYLYRNVHIRQRRMLGQ